MLIVMALTTTMMTTPILDLLGVQRVIGALADLMVLKGVPEHLRSENGPRVRG
jgi:hypothetical protein